MKPHLTQTALRLRALRKSRHQTQESLAARCRHYGFPVSRSALAKYEIGLLNIPAQFIPIAAHALNVDITELLPPIGGRAKPQPAPAQAKIRNLTGQQIQAFQKRRKQSRSKAQSSSVEFTQCRILIRIQNSRSKAAKNPEIATAVCALDKKVKLFFTLKTLNENGVEAENQPGRPA